MTNPLFLIPTQLPITGRVTSSLFVLPARPFCNVLNFPQKVHIMHDKSNLPFVLSHHSVAPPELPSLSYAPEGLKNVRSEHVLAYLASAESREPLPWLKDDIRISWLTVLHCAEGIVDPWRYAFWKYLGAVPEKIIPQLMARAEAHRLMEVPDFDPNAKIAPSPALPLKKEIA